MNKRQKDKDAVIRNALVYAECLKLDMEILRDELKLLSIKGLKDFRMVLLDIDNMIRELKEAA